MALRVGQPPSAGARLFFERAFQAAAEDPERFNPTDPFEQSRRLDMPAIRQLFGVKYSLIILGVFLGFMIIFNVVGMMVVVGRENWLFAGLTTAVVGLSLFYYLRLRLDSGGTNGAHSQLGAWRRCVLL